MATFLASKFSAESLSFSTITKCSQELIKVRRKLVFKDFKDLTTNGQQLSLS